MNITLHRRTISDAGDVRSYVGAHRHLTGTPHLSFRTLAILSFTGGAIGAGLLLCTPSQFFGRLVPWLVLFATTMFAIGDFRKTRATRNRPSPWQDQFGHCAFFDQHLCRLLRRRRWIFDARLTYHGGNAGTPSECGQNHSGHADEYLGADNFLVFEGNLLDAGVGRVFASPPK